MEARFELDLSKIPYVKGSVNNKILRIAINKAAAPVKAAVIGNAPVGKGRLNKSIRIKIKYYKAGNIWVAIIGPSSSFKRSGGKVKRGENKGQKKVVYPSRYAKLLEKGTKYRAATPFLKPSLDQTGSTYIQTIQDSVSQQLEEAMK